MKKRSLTEVEIAQATQELLRPSGNGRHFLDANKVPTDFIVPDREEKIADALTLLEGLVQYASSFLAACNNGPISALRSRKIEGEFAGVAIELNQGLKRAHNMLPRSPVAGLSVIEPRPAEVSPK